MRLNINMDISLLIIIIILILSIIISLNKYYFVDLVSNYDYVNDMPIYVINLKSRPDKKIKAISELNYHDIKRIFIEAIDGRNLEIDGIRFDQIYKQNNTYRKLRRGEIGCFLSHIVCWNLILNSGKSYGMVLEDDVVFVDNFKYLFNKEFKIVRDLDWDILAMARRCNNKLFDKNCEGGEIISTNTFYPNFVGYCTIAYVIKTSAIKKLIKNMFPFNKPIDVLLLELQQNKTIKILSFIRNLADVSSIVDSDTTRIK